MNWNLGCEKQFSIVCFSCLTSCHGSESDEVYILYQFLVFSSVTTVYSGYILFPACFITRLEQDHFLNMALSIQLKISQLSKRVSNITVEFLGKGSGKSKLLFSFRKFKPFGRVESASALYILILYTQQNILFLIGQWRMHK